MPWFLFGFVAASVMRTGGDFTIPTHAPAFAASWSSLITTADTVAQTCLTIAMAAVGLSTGLSGIRTIGTKPLLIGIAAALLVGIVSAGAIALFV